MKHPLRLLLLALSLSAACGGKEDEDDAGGEEAGGEEAGGDEAGGEEGGDEAGGDEGGEEGGDEGGSDEGGGDGQTTVCGDVVCSVDQYCYTFTHGANPDSGSGVDGPECVDAPAECDGIATCACIQATAECSDCTETDGIRCDVYGA